MQHSTSTGAPWDRDEAGLPALQTWPWRVSGPQPDSRGPQGQGLGLGS